MISFIKIIPIPMSKRYRVITLALVLFENCKLTKNPKQEYSNLSKIQSKSLSIKPNMTTAL
jgi:hypothetical protein